MENMAQLDPSNSRQGMLVGSCLMVGAGGGADKELAVEVDAGVVVDMMDRQVQKDREKGRESEVQRQRTPGPITCSRFRQPA